MHGPHGKRKHSARWVELCRELGWAHLVVTIDLKKNNRPRRLHDNIYATLAEMAVLLDMPTLATAPLAPLGHSAGGMTLPAVVRKDRSLSHRGD